MALRGSDVVKRNLRRALDNMTDGAEQGLLAAATFISGEAGEITPQEFGVLINSRFVDTGRDGGGLVARVGYTALYAVFVHEMPETNNFTKPDTGPKFLERPLDENHQTILRIIAKRSRGNLRL